MVIDGSKILLGTIHIPVYDLDVKVSEFEIYVKAIKVLKISSVLRRCMDLLYIILFITIPTPAYDIEVKVTDLKIYVKCLHQSF